MNFPVPNLKFSRSFEIQRCVLGENLIVGDMSATTTMARVVSVLNIFFPEMTERLTVLFEIRGRVVEDFVLL